MTRYNMCKLRQSSNNRHLTQVNFTHGDNVGEIVGDCLFQHMVEKQREVRNKCHIYTKRYNSSRPFSYSRRVSSRILYLCKGKTKKAKDEKMCIEHGMYISNLQEILTAEGLNVGPLCFK